MNLDLKKMMPLLSMMGGGSGISPDLLAKMSSGAGNNPQELLPLLMQMMKPKGAPAPSPSASAPPPPAPRGPGRARYFTPILDFADEKIIYHLTLLLQ